MTTEDLQRIDQTIQRYGDGWWNDPNDDVEGDDPNPNRSWVIEELLRILRAGGLDLSLIPLK